MRFSSAIPAVLLQAYDETGAWGETVLIFASSTASNVVLGLRGGRKSAMCDRLGVTRSDPAVSHHEEQARLCLVTVLVVDRFFAPASHSLSNLEARLATQKTAHFMLLLL
jgi:hypothetical protein